jgi:hypothetical protein
MLLKVTEQDADVRCARFVQRLEDVCILADPLVAQPFRRDEPYPHGGSSWLVKMCSSCVSQRCFLVDA